MFNLLRNHSGEYHTGIYFLKYPTLPLNEAGRFFRFKEAHASGGVAEIGGDMEYSSVKKTVYTTYAFDWKERAYVLSDNTLWIINEWSVSEEAPKAPMPMKTAGKRFALELIRVDNVTGIRV